VGYDASVKFDSSQAERNVNSLSSKMSGLAKRFQEANASIVSSGKAVAASGSSMSASSAKAAKLAQSMGTVSRATREAARDMSTFGKAINLSNIDRASQGMKMFALYLTQASGRISTMRKNVGVLPSLFQNLGKATTTATTGLASLSRTIGTSLPRIERLVGALGALGAALRGSAGSYRVTVSGLAGTGAAATKATASVHGVTGAFTSSGSASRKYARDLQIANSKMLSFAATTVRARNLLAYLATGFGVSAIFGMTDSFKLMNARLMVVSKTAQEAGASFAALTEASNRTRTPIEENVKAFTRFRIAGDRYNMQAGDALRLTENFNKMLIISGASTGEAAAATQQLSQAFAKGRLDGDEFRSIMENNAIAGQLLGSELKDLGINMGNLRDASKEGRINIKALMQAFASDKVTKKLEDQFKQIPLTIGQALTVARNNLIIWLGTVDRSSGFTAKLAQWIVKLSFHFDTIGRAAMIAGGLMAAGYIPKLVETIRLTRVLLALRLAAYLTGISGAAKEAKVAMGLWTGVMNAGGATGIAGFITRLKNMRAASTLTMEAMGGVFRNFFLRIPALAAVGLVTMAAWDKEVMKAGDVSVTAGDYVVSGLSILWDSFTNFLSGQMSQLTSNLSNAADATLREIDRIYRAIRGVIAAASLLGNLHAEKTGAMPWDFKITGAPTLDQIQTEYNKGYNSHGIKTDIAGAFKGTAVEKGAIDRATARANAGKGAAGGLGGGNMDYGDDQTGKKKGKKHKAKKPKEDHTIDQLKDALKALEGQIDETEGKRQEFSDGVDTLSKAFKAGLIPVDRYKQDLEALAQHTFPGLKDKIEELQKTGAELKLKAAGASDWEIEFRGVADEQKKQIDQIDTIIAKGGDVDGTLQRQKQVLIEQLGIYGQQLAVNKNLEAAADARKKREEQVSEVISDASKQLYDMFTTNLRDALDFSSGSFKKFFKSLLSMAKDMTAKLIGAAVFGPIQNSFQRAMEKAMGVPQTPKTGAATPVGSLGPSNKQNNTIQSVISLVSGGNKVSAKSDNGIATIDVPAFPGNENNGNQSTGSGSNQDNSDVVVTGHRMTFLDHVVRGYKDGVKGYGDLLKPIGKVLKTAADKLGVTSKTMGKIGEYMGAGLAGAQTGAAIAPIGKKVWGRFSTGGAEVGGAIGGMIGKATGIPGAEQLGAIGGAIWGGVIGGLIKGIQKSSSTVSIGEDGRAKAAKAVGNNNKAESKAAADGMASALQDVADQLGVQLKTMSNVVSIGQYKGKYIVDESGTGKTRGPGTPSFKTEEEAAKYALKIALQKGVLKGLSATSDNYLKKIDDVDIALKNVSTFEAVMKQGKAIKDPLGGAFLDFKKQLDDTITIFKTMGATADDWKVLQSVAQDEFTKTLDGVIKGLKDFRDSLVGGQLSYLSPTEQLKFSDQKFTDMEAKVASGTYVPQEDFLNSAQSLIDLAREVYGSTPEFAAYQKRILSATDKLIDNVNTEAEKYKPIVDAIGSQTTAVVTAINNLANAVSGGSEQRWCRWRGRRFWRCRWRSIVCQPQERQ
jgi:tape measure domain-containing protein